MKDPVIKKIILATDFSEASKNATYHAILEAKKHNAKLTAMHVFDTSVWNIPAHYYFAPARPPGFSDLIEDCEKARQRGRETLKIFEKSFNTEVESVFRESDEVGEEIVNFSKEQNADLLVLGTHGYGGWNRLTMGSVAEFVVRNAPCAVLTVKPEGKK